MARQYRIDRATARKISVKAAELGIAPSHLVERIMRSWLAERDARVPEPGFRNAEPVDALVALPLPGKPRSLL